MTTADQDPFLSWVRLEVRRAEISFRDAHRKLEQEIAERKETQCGWRVKKAIQLIERAVVAFVVDAKEEAKQLIPTIGGFEAGRAELSGLIGRMGAPVIVIAHRLNEGGDSVSRAAIEKIASIRADALNAYALIKPIEEPPHISETLDDCPRHVLPEGYMGMMEVLAWIGTRNTEVATQIGACSLMKLPPGGSASAVAAISLLDDLSKEGVSIKNIEAELISRCAGKELVAIGSRDGDFAEIPALNWHGASIIHESEPDTLLMHGPLNGLGAPRYRLVRFARNDVLRVWPARPRKGVDMKPNAKRTVATNRPGPKAAWRHDLAKFFQNNHDSLAELSQRLRHKVVASKFSSSHGKPQSAGTTERHWNKHLERRAKLG